MGAASLGMGERLLCSHAMSKKRAKEMLWVHVVLFGTGAMHVAGVRH